MAGEWYTMMMHTERLIAATVILAVMSYAQAPQFLAQKHLFAAGDTIRVEFFSSPHVFDWDGDGDKDVLVGQFVNGHILLYDNVGSNNDPLFAPPEYVYADGSIITLPYS